MAFIMSLSRVSCLYYKGTQVWNAIRPGNGDYSLSSEKHVGERPCIY